MLDHFRILFLPEVQTVFRDACGPFCTQGTFIEILSDMGLGLTGKAAFMRTVWSDVQKEAFELKLNQQSIFLPLGMDPEGYDLTQGHLVRWKKGRFLRRILCTGLWPEVVYAIVEQLGSRAVVML